MANAIYIVEFTLVFVGAFALAFALLMVAGLITLGIAKVIDFIGEN